MTVGEVWGGLEIISGGRKTEAPLLLSDRGSQFHDGADIPNMYTNYRFDNLSKMVYSQLENPRPSPPTQPSLGLSAAIGRAKFPGPQSMGALGPRCWPLRLLKSLRPLLSLHTQNLTSHP